MKRADVAARSRFTSNSALNDSMTDPVLAAIRKSMPTATREMQLSPEEGALLRWLLHLTRAQNVLEIGTGVGYSTIWLAGALPKDGQLITIEKSAAYHAQAVSNVQKTLFKALIELKHGAAEDILPTLPDKHFDAVFIDANKQSYPEYFKQADRLLRPGGLLIVDDIMLFASSQEKRTIKMTAAINCMRDMVYQNPRYYPVMLPMWHGLLLAQKQLAIV